MDDLIKALTILRKYGNPRNPTHCEHDVLFVNIHPDKVTVTDKLDLNKLGFECGEDGDDYEGGFYSFRFGSC